MTSAEATDLVVEAVDVHKARVEGEGDVHDLMRGRGGKTQKKNPKKNPKDPRKTRKKNPQKNPKKNPKKTSKLMEKERKGKKRRGIGTMLGMRDRDWTCKPHPIEFPHAGRRTRTRTRSVLAL